MKVVNFPEPAPHLSAEERKTFEDVYIILGRLAFVDGNPRPKSEAIVKAIRGLASVEQAYSGEVPQQQNPEPNINAY